MDHRRERERIEQANQQMARQLVGSGSNGLMDYTGEEMMRAARRKWSWLSRGRSRQIVDAALLIPPASLTKQVAAHLRADSGMNGRGLEWAMEVFTHGLDGERSVSATAKQLGVSRRHLFRRLASCRLAGPQHWLMAARVVWGIYTVCVTGCTFRELSRRTQVEQASFSQLCLRATGERPTMLRDLCFEAGNLTPIIDRLAADYLWTTQERKGRHAP